MQGMGVGAGLIVAIGPQNAFILKQGILKNHVFMIASICVFIDVVMISIGVNGVGKVLASSANFINAAKWAGIVFLLFYAFRSFMLALKKQSLELSNSNRMLSRTKCITSVLMFSFLNPHMYLDTFVLLGSISAQFNIMDRPSFLIGAITASIIWFYLLAYGSKKMAIFFHKPKSWMILDFCIGIVMTSIAISLYFGI